MSATVGPTTPAPLVSVIMPTFDQAAWIPRAVRSLLGQTLADWELVVVDDGSPDSTRQALHPFLGDGRVRYVRLPGNQGLGAATNRGLEEARGPLVAYLPSDDVYDPEHLACLVEVARRDRPAMAHSGVRYGSRAALGPPDGFPLQPVQVLHPRGRHRWAERGEVESDDLHRLSWARLLHGAQPAATGRVTCEWTQHPLQRTRTIRESLDGGLNTFRARYGVREPLRFHSSDGGLVDEPALYARFSTNRDRRADGDGPRVLLVGELGFHPERILALEEAGCRLFGLWIGDPLGSQTVGPLPFGHVEDLSAERWRDDVDRVRPDVVYALLGWRAVPLALEVATGRPDLPFVWHFKESPQRCMARGTWPALVDLESRADAVIHASGLERRWIERTVPEARKDSARSLVLDGELLKREWLDGAASARLSDVDGEIHTVVLGRPLGMDVDLLRALGAARVHVHLYGLIRSPGPGGAWEAWLEDARRAAPGRVHVHPAIDQRSWLSELSRYDAGWLHRFRSDNGGDLGRATWDDLNLPARIPALVAAGLPLLQQASPGASVAAQDLVLDRRIGILYEDADDLSERLHDRATLDALRVAVWDQREWFTFDAHAGALVDLFRAVAR